VLADGLSKIVRYETQLMAGRRIPTITSSFTSALVKAAAWSMPIPPPSAPQTRAPPITTSAHEFFHLWNVKRIRRRLRAKLTTPKKCEPERSGSPKASRVPTARTPWFAPAFGQPTSSTATSPDKSPSCNPAPRRLWQSVEESSLDAWFEKYPMYRGPEFSISYYNKGQLDGVLLDVLIRDATDNNRSLDDVIAARSTKISPSAAAFTMTARISKKPPKLSRA